MGKGDKKSKRGKIIIGSWGVSRPRKSKKERTKITARAPKAEAKDDAKKAQKKAPAKKPKKEKSAEE